MNLDETIRISVVIPCRNEEEYIAEAIESVLRSNIPNQNLQIIAVDGMSDDRTREIVEGLSELHPNVHLVDNPERITPVAMNIGFKHLPFDYGMIMGAHSTLEPDYIPLCLEKLLSDQRIGCVGGLIRNTYADKRSKTIGLAMSSKFGVGNAFFRTGGHEGPVDTVGTPIYRKKVLEEAGYFDESLVRNQDDELNYRIRKSGYTIWLLNEPRFNYYVRASWKKLFRQYRQYGYWKVFVNRKHSTITSLRQLVPAGLVFFLIGLPFLCLLLPVLWWVYAGMISLYLFTAAAAAINISNGRMFISLVVTFLVLHLSYGIGYWQGILSFLVLRRNPSEKQAQLSR